MANCLPARGLRWTGPSIGQSYLSSGSLGSVAPWRPRRYPTSFRDVKNRGLGRSDVTLPPEPRSASLASGTDDPERALTKHRGYTEEMVAVVEKAAANVRPRPASWPVENSKAHVEDEVEELIMFGPECSAGGRAGAGRRAAGGGGGRGRGAARGL